MAPKKIIKDEWVLKKDLEFFITEETEIDYSKARKLCNLFKDGCEVAYVARYRGDVHGGINCEQVRKAFESFNEANELNKKVAKSLNNVIVKIENIEEKTIVEDMFKSCNDVSEVTEISKMYSSGKRKTKASIAKELGFEKIAQKIIDREFVGDLKFFMTKQLDTIEKVEEQVIISLADIINKMESTIKCINKISKLQEPYFQIHIVSSLTNKTKKSKNELDIQHLLTHFKDYVDFKKSAKTIQDYQILALERAESNEILSWKAEIEFEEAKKYHPSRMLRVEKKMEEIWKKSLKYSITKSFIPKIQRAVRRFLSQRAQSAAIKCFTSNIDQLFARDGLKNVYVIALDPGFSACKAAFLRPDGSVIETSEFRLQNDGFEKKGEMILIKWSQISNGMNIVFAIGNGKGTYETQSSVANMIRNQKFSNKIDISFCVVPEDGASKYSITELATKEFPNMKPTEISAVSIGRRLIDPMDEYVKIDPQHLGKGMYQHSVNTTKLSESLKYVVRERVSMRGVDVNFASENLLQHVCGLNRKIATGIVEYRRKMNGIRSRQELLKVPGLGNAAFEQCAGFLKVSKVGSVCFKNDDEPENKKKKGKIEKLWNPLDETIVHPNQYETAERVLKKLNFDINEVSNIEKFKKAHENFKESWNEEETTVIQLLLTKPHVIPPPPLLKSVRDMKSLQINSIVTGVVQNHTDFGIFVDIGVQRNALAHCKCFKKEEKWPEVGTSLEFYVTSIDQQRGRISIKPV